MIVRIFSQKKITLKKNKNILFRSKKDIIFAPAFREYLMRLNTGEMAEWSNALVLKTSEGHTSGGSNPSFSAYY